MGKLVRDNIPQLIRNNGREPDIEVISGEKLLKALEDKLKEEVHEYLTADTPDHRCEELADIVEVVISLAAQFNCDFTQLMELTDNKRESRGAFQKGYFYLENQK